MPPTRSSPRASEKQITVFRCPSSGWARTGLEDVPAFLQNLPVVLVVGAPKNHGPHFDARDIGARKSGFDVPIELL